MKIMRGTHRAPRFLVRLFCYRLILREEFELRASQGAAYEGYQNSVPRLFPAPLPRIPSAGRPSSWAAGFKAEFWYRGFAVALASFPITLSFKLFLVLFGASLAIFWLSTRMFVDST